MAVRAVSNIKLLVSGFTSNRGGVESFVMNYYREMRRIEQSLVIDVIGYTPEPAFHEEIEGFGGKVYVMPSPKRLGHSKAIKKFFEGRSNEYDAYWCNKCDLHDIDFLRMAANHIPRRILHAHSSRLNYRGLRNTAFGILHRRNKQLASHLATDYWSCSDWAARWIFPEWVGDEIKCVPNAIQMDAFSFDEYVRRDYRTKMGLSGVVYGCVGCINKIKNTVFSVETFVHLWNMQPNSYLVLVGSGEDLEDLRRRVETLPCADHILFLGMRQDVPQLLQAMDCLLMPSLFEGFPVASVEAQAAGLPVFAASDGITPQAQLTDLFHFLPLSLGPDGWAEEILKTDLTRKDRREALREKGFDIAFAARELLDTFRQ